MRLVLVLTMLALAGCDREPLTQAQHDAVTDIADDSVDDSGKVQELEERIESLEERLLQANIPE